MDVEKIESSAQGYYDDPNALNFHKQVCIIGVIGTYTTSG